MDFQGFQSLFLFVNNQMTTVLNLKIFYGMMIDKMGASLKNKWLDEEGRVYIVYPVTEIQADMNLSKRKTLDCLSELEAIGLIEKRRRGGGLPSIIYVKNFATANAI